MARSADWYFDFISPFSYLQFKSFASIGQSLEIRLVPILFAGLLKHWGQKAPAEIPTKRVETYQFCHWTADQLNIPFRMPPTHPFNPLRALRLALALGGSRDTVDEIFNFIWKEGNDVSSDTGFNSLAERLNVDNVNMLISSLEVKNALHENTRNAIARGVYGVPTFDIEGLLFWGFDKTDMLIEYLEHPEIMTTPEMFRLTTIPPQHLDNDKNPNN